MIIRSLRVNHIENPLGYKMDKPFLSWTAESETGKKQIAARVEISLSETFDSLEFDSGLHADISPLGYVPEMTLQPRTRYFWRVTVVSDCGETATSAPAWFETGKQGEAWQAKWIRAPYENSVHPILKKVFTLKEKPVRARAYAAGLGVYELNLNGKKAGDEVLAPFYNDYNLWIQYQTYDVTDLLTAGENTIDAWLGNGWYKGRLSWYTGQPDFNEKTDCIYGNAMQLIAELRVEFADGTETVITTDESWQCAHSTVMESSIYDGEVYDARLENAPFDASAELADTPKGPLTERLSPPLRVVDHVVPRELIHTPKGEWVIDFGQEMTGWVEFNCDLPEGARAFLQFGELLQNDCFYNENLRSAKAEYTFISAGKKSHVRPHFTFYGFRFMKVEGIENIQLSDFDGCVIHSDIPVIGEFTTSNAKVNRLIQNAFWGQIGNFLDTPTDCPQRDERTGWTGDAHVFAPTASFNMYTPAFYEKYLHDMLLEQKTLGGSVPHVVPDILDQIQLGIQKQAFPTHHGSCGWGDAAIGIPWTMYEFYGDKEMLVRQYENMKLWTDWIRSQVETHCPGRNLWLCGFHFADWLALDNPVQGSSFGGTDPHYVASAYYYNAAKTVSLAAQALGYAEDAAEYAILSEEIKEAFREEYFTPTGRIAQPTQTAMVLALSMHLAPEKDRERLKADLREKLRARNDHLDTGFVGTYYLCRALSENGMSDVAYTLLLNEDFPSWLYEVNMGATTVWERWNSVLPNGLVSDTGMNSLNHYAYGSIVEWMYRFMAGLNPAVPGFARARIAPKTDARFEFAHAKYDSASGIYESGWKHTPNGDEFTVTVPFNCEADFIPETLDGEWTLNGVPAPIEDGAIHLSAGKYTIVHKK